MSSKEEVNKSPQDLVNVVYEWPHRIQQYYLQQQKLKQQHEEERKKRQQVEKSFISTNNTTKISKSATLIAAANAGKIAVGPIPLEIARNNMSPPTQQPAPIPPYPSPILQRKDNNLGNLSTYPIQKSQLVILEFI